MSSEHQEYQDAYNFSIKSDNKENFYNNNNYERLVKEYSQALSNVLHANGAAQLSEISTTTITDQKFRIKGDVKLFTQGNKFIARTDIPPISVGDYEFKEQITVHAAEIDEVIREVSECVAAIFAERVVLKKKVKRDMPKVTHFKKPEKPDQLTFNY